MRPSWQGVVTYREREETHSDSAEHHGSANGPHACRVIAPAATDTSLPGGERVYVLKRLAAVITARRAPAVIAPPQSGSAPPADELDAPAEPAPGHHRDGKPDGAKAAQPVLDEFDKAAGVAGDPVEVGMQSSQEPAADAAPARRSGGRKTAGLRSALIVGALAVAALSGLGSWLGYRAHQAHDAAQQAELFVQVAQQAAINLSTISYTEADADVVRILDSATGKFHDEFQQRSQPFVDVVKQAQSTTQGSVTAAGLQSVAGDHAQVIVAVSVKTTSTAGAPEQHTRGWRMLLDLQKVGDTAKVSDVRFVS